MERPGTFWTLQVSMVLKPGPVHVPSVYSEHFGYARSSIIIIALWPQLSNMGESYSVLQWRLTNFSTMACSHLCMVVTTPLHHCSIRNASPKVSTKLHSTFVVLASTHVHYNQCIDFTWYFVNPWKISSHSNKFFNPIAGEGNMHLAKSRFWQAMKVQSLKKYRTNWLWNDFSRLL